MPSFLSITIIVVLVLALGYFAWDKFRSPPSTTINPATAGTSEIASEPENRSATPAQRSLAVLPFIDMSQAKDNEYFTDGLTEELLNILAQIKSLRV